MKKYIPYTLSLFFIFTIFFLSLQDAPTSNALSTSLTTRIWELCHTLAPSLAQKLPASIGGFNHLIRELAHILEYFLLSICLLFTFGLNYRTKLTLWYTSVAILWIALIDETIQYLCSSGRAFQLVDLFKDWLGLGLAILLYVLFQAVIHWYTQSKNPKRIHYYKNKL